MSGSTSQNPTISHPPATGPAPGSTTSGFGSVNAYPSSNSFRMKSESSYEYDDQAPRSQQAHANYTHQDLTNGSLAQTQAFGGLASGSGSSYGEPSRSSGGPHYISQHTRHQSLSTSVGQMGISAGNIPNGSYNFPNDPNSNYGAYNPQPTGNAPGQRSPLGRPTGLETSPTRSRFPSTGYHDGRPTARLPARSGLGLSALPGVESESPKMKTHNLYPESSSPRSLKRAAEHLDEPRGAAEHASALRRPASFPALGTNTNAYGRPISSDPRATQTMVRGRGSRPSLTPGQGTPLRTPTMLPTVGYYDSDGRRESFSSNTTMQSPVPSYHGPSSSEELPGPYMAGPPPLMRSTQIPGAATSGISGDPTYSPPVSSANRAKLELHGNLNDMAIGWSHDEWRSGRRLVQFWRRQEGSVIHTTFRPIMPNQYVPNSIVISCIFREDKNECYVTSVDTIYLLEALVASRFTVEEKNRIRRNLEGFRPMTVSKNKRECEKFFKLIMSFPNPKPRNIEKDVKVFPWKVLSSALCKIIGKYSALDGGVASMSDPMSSSSDASMVCSTPLGATNLSGVDLSGGHYRENEYYGPSPGVRDTRLSDPTLDYERSGHGIPSYGSGMHPAIYGSTAPSGDFHARSRSTGSALAFNEFLPGNAPHTGGGAPLGIGAGAGPNGHPAYPPSGSTNSMPFPSHTDSSYTSQNSSHYDGFGSSSNHQPTSGGAADQQHHLYGQEQSQPQGQTQATDDSRLVQPQHQRNMSGSTLAAAAASGYYGERR